MIVPYGNEWIARVIMTRLRIRETRYSVTALRPKDDITRHEEQWILLDETGPGAGKVSNNPCPMLQHSMCNSNIACDIIRPRGKYKVSMYFERDALDWLTHSFKAPLYSLVVSISTIKLCFLIRTCDVMVTVDQVNARVTLIVEN